MAIETTPNSDGRLTGIQKPDHVPAEPQNPKEPYIYTTDYLRMQIMQADQVPIEYSVAESRLRLTLENHREFPSIRRKIPGKKGPPMRVFTQTQRDTIIAEAGKRGTRRVRGFSSSAEEPEAPTAQLARPQTIFAGENGSRESAAASNFHKEDHLKTRYTIPTLEVSQDGILGLDGTLLTDLSEMEKGLVTFLAQRTTEGETSSFEDVKNILVKHGGKSTIGERQLRAKVEDLSEKLLQANCVVENTVKVPGKKAALILRKLTPDDDRQDNQGKAVGTATKPLTSDEITMLQREKERNLKEAARYVLSLIRTHKTDPKIFEKTWHDKWKKEFINGFSLVLERLWNRDPNIPNGISEVEGEIIEECKILKYQGYSIEEIIQDISGRLKIPPPGKYRVT